MRVEVREALAHVLEGSVIEHGGETEWPEELVEYPLVSTTSIASSLHYFDPGWPIIYDDSLEWDTLRMGRLGVRLDILLILMQILDGGILWD